MISYSLAELKTVYSSYGRFRGGVDVLELMQMVKRCCKWVQFSFSTVYTFLDKIVRMIDSEKSFHTGGIIFHGYHYIRISVLTDTPGETGLVGLLVGRELVSLQSEALKRVITT